MALGYRFFAGQAATNFGAALGTGFTAFQYPKLEQILFYEKSRRGANRPDVV
ncbi:MAG: hypothetical protein ACK2TV_16435 [Anaerolineales bacterium]